MSNSDQSPAGNADTYSFSDFCEDSEQGGDVDWAAAPVAQSDRCLAIAEKMVQHMAENQHPSYMVTGRVWTGDSGVVRVYTNVGSYVELDDDGESVNCSHRVGPNRGSEQALDAAWEAAD